MTITHYERARFLVESQSDEEDYLVDLLEYRRCGFCGCKDFAITIQPKWEAGEVPEKKWCKHIRAVRDFLARAVKAAADWLNDRQLQRQVDRIIFRWARQESSAQLNPIRYGTN